MGAFDTIRQDRKSDHFVLREQGLFNIAPSFWVGSLKLLFAETLVIPRYLLNQRLGCLAAHRDIHCSGIVYTLTKSLGRSTVYGNLVNWLEGFGEQVDRDTMRT